MELLKTFLQKIFSIEKRSMPIKPSKQKKHPHSSMRNKNRMCLHILLSIFFIFFNRKELESISHFLVLFGEGKLC